MSAQAKVTLELSHSSKSYRFRVNLLFRKIDSDPIYFIRALERDHHCDSRPNELLGINIFYFKYYAFCIRFTDSISTLLHKATYIF